MASATSTATAANKIDRAHQMYRDGKYREALDCYTDALSMAKTNQQKIALHSNRAACYLKLHDFSKAAEECTSVLELDHNHTGALMLRAQTLVTLKDYHSAVFDVSRLIELNPSSEVYRNLQARLKTQLSLAPIPEDEAEFEEEEEEEEEDDDDDDKEDYNDIENSGDLQERNEVKKQEIDTNDIATTPDSISEPKVENQMKQKPSHQESSTWQTIPKPKGHSHLDYSKWDRVEDDSSDEEDEDDEDEEDSQPHYRFRVKTVGVKAVK